MNCLADKAFLKDLFSIENEKKQDEKAKSTDSVQDKSKTKTLSQKAITEDKLKIKEVHERKPVEKAVMTEIKFPETVKFDLSDSMKTFFENALKSVIEPLIIKLEETSLPRTKNLERVNIDNLIDETTKEDNPKKETDSDELQKFDTYYELVGESMKLQHQHYRKVKKLFTQGSIED
jgi:hypothetical protein